MEVKVLYLGMAGDIMLPLLVVENLTTLFVIDKFDPCYSKDKTWKGLKEDIKDVLSNGSDENSRSRKIHVEDHWNKSIHYLETKSIITLDVDDGSVWRLKFIYNRKERELIYY